MAGSSSRSNLLAGKAKTFGRFKSTIQALSSTIVSLFFEAEVLENARNNVEFMHDGSKTQEVLLPSLDSNPV